MCEHVSFEVVAEYVDSGPLGYLIRGEIEEKDDGAGTYGDSPLDESDR